MKFEPPKPTKDQTSSAIPNIASNSPNIEGPDFIPTIGWYTKKISKHVILIATDEFYGNSLEFNTIMSMFFVSNMFQILFLFYSSPNNLTDALL